MKSGKEYQLVWSDEFDKNHLDLNKWEFEINAWGGGNKELQFYTSRNKNCRIEDGRLIIEAHKEKFTGVCERTNKRETRDYTSARIRTKNKGDWKYGKFEIKAKIPSGQGLWPAIWMMPTDSIYGSWPCSGEIDIMESVCHEPDTVHGTIHYGDFCLNNVYTGAPYKKDNIDFSAGFHAYSLEWSEGEIKWFVDNVLYQTQNKWFSGNSKFPAPFDQKFHLIINLAVGGNWPGSPDNSTQFPAKFEIEYVRVYS